MSNYIIDLRSIVGHRTLLQVEASVIVEDTHYIYLNGDEVS